MIPAPTKYAHLTGNADLAYDAICKTLSERQAAEILRMASAVKLFELGKLSSGAAANLAGVPKVVFLSRLADYGVDTFELSEDDLQPSDSTKIYSLNPNE